MIDKNIIDSINEYIFKIKNNIKVDYSDYKINIMNFGNYLHKIKNNIVLTDLAFNIIESRHNIAHDKPTSNDIILDIIDRVSKLEDINGIVLDEKIVDKLEIFVTNKEIYEFLTNLNIKNVDKFTRIINTPETKRFLDEKNYININKKYVTNEEIELINYELNMKFQKCVYLRVHENITDEGKTDNYQNSILNWD